MSTSNDNRSGIWVEIFKPEDLKPIPEEQKHLPPKDSATIRNEFNNKMQKESINKIRLWTNVYVKKV